MTTRLRSVTDPSSHWTPPDAARTHALEQRIRALTALLYDTSVPAARLDAEVLPHLAEDVTFQDPWQSGRGKETYRLGMKGFHALFRFHFDFLQVSVQLNPAGDGGRALVDGTMQLEQLAWLYTFPLRTLLVYDFVLPCPDGPAAAERLLITAHEELWSFGDLLEALPLLGRVYAGLFRPAFGVGFVAVSRFASALQERMLRR